MMDMLIEKPTFSLEEINRLTPEDYLQFNAVQRLLLHLSLAQYEYDGKTEFTSVIDRLKPIKKTILWEAYNADEIKRFETYKDVCKYFDCDNIQQAVIRAKSGRLRGFKLRRVNIEIVESINGEVLKETVKKVY